MARGRAGRPRWPADLSVLRGSESHRSAVAPGRSSVSVRRHFRFVILRVDHLALAAGFAARNKYFTPTKDTEVEVRASDCAKVVRKVVVADQPVELIADSKWDSSCT